MDIVKGIKKIMKKENLDQNEMIEIMNQIMEGRATDAQIAGFLVALRLKGETVDEISGAAKVMREKSLKINPKNRPLIDIVGTGGDSSGTFNISTSSAFVVAAAGLAVAKHGNRSVSSKCGAADVLEELGVNLDIDSTKVENAVNDINIGFLFAVKHHSSMKYAIGPRKQLAVRTIFNVLGPLTNPAEAEIQLMGVYSKELVLPLAKVLRNLGLKRAMVVHGSNGMDEITITGSTFVAELKDNEIKEYEINPEIIRDIEEIQGGTAKENADIIRGIFGGEITGAKKEIVAINSGAVLYIAGKTDSLESGIALANEIIESGCAMEKLNEYIEYTNK